MMDLASQAEPPPPPVPAVDLTAAAGVSPELSGQAGAPDNASPPPEQGGAPPQAAVAEGEAQPTAEVKQASTAGMVGAGVGALAGGAANAYDAHRVQGQDLAAQRAQLDRVQPGSFRQAMRLAAQKSLLSFEQVGQQMPVASSLAGSLMGAGIGHATGEAINSLAGKLQRF